MGSSKRAGKCCSFSAPGLPDGSQQLKTLPNSTSNASQNEPKIAPKSPWGHLLEPGGCLVRILGYPRLPKYRNSSKIDKKQRHQSQKCHIQKGPLFAKYYKKARHEFGDSSALRASRRESYNIWCGSHRKLGYNSEVSVMKILGILRL